MSFVECGGTFFVFAARRGLNVRFAGPVGLSERNGTRQTALSADDEALNFVQESHFL